MIYDFNDEKKKLISGVLNVHGQARKRFGATDLRSSDWSPPGKAVGQKTRTDEKTETR